MSGFVHTPGALITIGADSSPPEVATPVILRSSSPTALIVSTEYARFMFTSVASRSPLRYGVVAGISPRKPVFPGRFLRIAACTMSFSAFR